MTGGVEDMEALWFGIYSDAEYRIYAEESKGKEFSGGPKQRQGVTVQATPLSFSVEN